ncbi:MAG: hypothetical protein RIC30_09355 [Marinoscillum sp.]|uniref:hypothetical protein n=1 Tax=Marinoscillum sp. TaxID=2024838 RepID=UPI003303CA15
MAEFKESGAYYVSKSGDNANAGTSKALPKLTINNYGGSGDVTVVGTGVYSIGGLTYGTGSQKLKADGHVIFDGVTGAATGFVGVRGDIDGCTWVNFGSNIGSSTNNSVDGDVTNSMFIGGTTYLYWRIDQKHKFNRFINSTLTLGMNSASAPGGCSYESAVHINSQFNLSKSTYAGSLASGLSIKSCYFDENSLVILPDADAAALTFNCCIRGQVRVDGVTYASLELARAAVGGFPGCISDDPLFIGDPSKGEFTVKLNSPLIGNGVLGVNIGNVKSGNLQNSDSLEWGLSPSSNLNTNFSATKTLKITDGGTFGTRISKEIDLGQVVRSPIIIANGLIDMINNVPDSNNTLVNPNHLCADVSYAGIDKVYSAFKSFRLGEKMQLDTGGKSTGQTGFDWNNLVDIEMRYLKISVTVRNNYSVS